MEAIRRCSAVTGPKDYPRYSLKGTVVEARKGTVQLYDPDTLFVAFKTNEDSQCFCYSLRVEGIDSIENRIKKSDLALLTHIQQEALLKRRETALNYMQQLLDENDLLIHLGENDKYGRTLSKVFTTSGIDVASDLINRKLVFPYGGDTKLTIVQQANFCIQNPAIVNNQA